VVRLSAMARISRFSKTEPRRSPDPTTTAIATNREPILEAGASFSTVCAHRPEDPWESRTTSLMEPIGAWSRRVVNAKSPKNMVGPCELEPQTSTRVKKLPQSFPRIADNPGTTSDTSAFPIVVS
jgi:hypothetical protein